MQRRSFLGTCAGAGIVGLSGCLGPVVGATTRTRARPAFAMPPVGRWADRPDDGDATGSLRANNHNTTRSNRYTPIAGPTGDVTVEWTISTSELRSRNFNSGRAEGDGRTFDAPEADRERTYRYLAADPVIGETAVVAVPSVDLPGVDDPAEAIAPKDVIPTAGSFRDDDDDDSPGAAVADLLAFTGVSGVSELSPAVNEATPLLYQGLSRAGFDDAGPFVVQWVDAPSRGSNADAVSEPVVARATATLDGDVRLPVLMFARRLKHAGDYLFVVGWVVDAGALYDDATSLLVSDGPTQVVPVSPTAVRQPRPPAAVVDPLTDRQRIGSLTFDGPAAQDLRPYLPEGFRPGGDRAAAFVEAARVSAGRGRTGRAAEELRLPAYDDRDDDPPQSEVLDVTVVNLDATVGHLTGRYDGDFEALWSRAA